MAGITITWRAMREALWGEQSGVIECQQQGRAGQGDYTFFCLIFRRQRVYVTCANANAKKNQGALFSGAG